ncbi:hypothetical protein A5647_26215 [Mycobacterium sp. 1100029.7]|nr:hypothetical protein A5647_26215 [Mycobacterium sp. 1100029.7]
MPCISAKQPWSPRSPRITAERRSPPAPDAPQPAAKVGYTQKVWDAIRGENVNGNDALDSLALSGPVS